MLFQMIINVFNKFASMQTNCVDNNWFELMDLFISQLSRHLCVLFFSLYRLESLNLNKTHIKKLFVVVSKCWRSIDAPISSATYTHTDTHIQM